ILTPPRRPSSTMRIFSSAECCRRVALRISRTVFSALSGTRLLACLIVVPQWSPMSQKSSLTQLPHSVQHTLPVYTPRTEHAPSPHQDHATIIRGGGMIARATAIDLVSRGIGKLHNA